MINNKYKFIFMHLPKTAGQSISSVMKKLEDDASDFYLPGHVRANEYIEVMGRERFDSYFKFGVIRNPWDRVVSHYCFWRSRDLGDGIKRKKANVKGIKFCKKHSFREYILAFDEISILRPSSEFFSVNDRMVLDYVIRFEELQKGFDEVCTILGIDHRLLPVINKGVMRAENTTYSKYYDDETKGIVEVLFESDIRQYGYTYEDDM